MAQVTKGKHSDAKRFELFARDHIITWVNKQTYWRRTHEKQANNALMEVIELLQVCSFYVKVKFNTKHLTPGIFYNVSFVIKLTDKAGGWELPVNVKLILPNGYTITHKEDFKTKPRNEWIRILAGEFRIIPGKELDGDMEISMFETSDDHWKRGLLLDYVDIQPVQ